MTLSLIIFILPPVEDMKSLALRCTSGLDFTSLQVPKERVRASVSRNFGVVLFGAEDEPLPKPCRGSLEWLGLAPRNSRR